MSIPSIATPESHADPLPEDRPALASPLSRFALPEEFDVPDPPDLDNEAAECVCGEPTCLGTCWPAAEDSR